MHFRKMQPRWVRPPRRHREGEQTERLGEARKPPCDAGTGRTPAGTVGDTTADRQNFGKISAKCCSFSAVSAPISTRKYAFCGIFQNLPDYLADIFEIWQNFLNFATFRYICKIFAEFSQKLLIFQTDFWLHCNDAKVFKCVEFEKCCQTHIFLQNFVLIQPRTSPPKICKNVFCKILQNFTLLMLLILRR